MARRTTPSGRRRSLGARGKILSVGAAVMVAAILVGTLGFTGLGSAGKSREEVAALKDAVSYVQTIEAFNGEITGWQIVFVWVVWWFWPVAAVQPTQGGNRAGFVDAVGRLKAVLAAPPVIFSKDEAGTFDRLKAKWDQYFAIDDK